MTSSRKRARPGDVIEVVTPSGLAYVQYVGKHPKYGDAIRVLPGFFQEQPRDWSALLAQEGYVTFYPLNAAVSQELVTVAASEAILPGKGMPSVWRRAGWRNEDGKAVLWFICEGDKETRRPGLSEEEKRLPIMAIWNHEFLVTRMVGEWRPERDS